MVSRVCRKGALVCIEYNISKRTKDGTHSKTKSTADCADNAVEMIRLLGDVIFATPPGAVTVVRNDFIAFEGGST